MKRRQFIAGALNATGLAAAAGAGADSRYACVADRVFDGRQVLDHHAVIVSCGRIAGIVPTASLPPGMPVLTEPGCTLLPGLIDSHVHFMRWQGPQYLAWGVTTVRDTGNALEWILERRVECTRRPWPRILCVGPLLDGPSPLHPLVSLGCADRTGAVEAVRSLADAGVDAIKLYVGLDPGWIADMVAVAHAAGLRVSMHCPGAGVPIAARSGVDEFHHLDGVLDAIWPEHPPGWLEAWGYPGLEGTLDRQRELADLIAESGMSATPTLAYWRSQWRDRVPGEMARREQRLVPPELVRLQSPCADAAGAAQWRRALAAAQGFVGLLLERGVRVLPGTDTPCGAVAPGLSLWRELCLLVEAGMPPLQALRSATSDAADNLGRREIGRLRAGCAADMVLVQGNPAERLDPEPKVVATIRGGVCHRPSDLLAEATGGAFDTDDDPWMEQFRAHGLA